VEVRGSYAGIILSLSRKYVPNADSMPNQQTVYCNIVNHREVWCVDIVARDGNYFIRRLGMLEDGDQLHLLQTASYV
jgi:hypothetical protein